MVVSGLAIEAKPALLGTGDGEGAWMEMVADAWAL